MVIYFTRYHPDKSITMLNLCYDELIENTDEYERKKHLVLDDYTRDKVLYKIIRIGFEKLNDIRILIDTDYKLPNDITLKNVILMSFVIKNGDQFHSKLFLEEASHDE